MRYRAPKGVHDIFSPDIHIWQRIELSAQELFKVYGYTEIRTPIIEYTEVFTRSIGEDTDIVEKEMYTFYDKAGRSISLRPEGTASVVRCYVEHSLYTLPSPQKFFYMGPMFRYERPQKGRFRQFYQIGVEAFGESHPAIDAEIISMLYNFLKKINLNDVNFELNSIGCQKCRTIYRETLLSSFMKNLDNFCPDCQRRYHLNPLRILDCKVDRCIEARQEAPSIIDFLCEDCKKHHEEVIERLSYLQIPYVINPNLVRGLDYYTKTVFEATTSNLGAQRAVAAGGRYDRLVEEFGGPPTPAIGFAIGMERLITLLKEVLDITINLPDLYIATIGEKSEKEGFQLAEILREKGLRVEIHYGGGSLRSQLRRADRLGARFVLILGEDELKTGMIKWKDLNKKQQGEIEYGNLPLILNLIKEG
ncbi:MAG: histidine--tRNA ligase [Thermodesulfovibrionales bacterium]|nr:histidine--tRNA ligase [Thermodesulfovibrionales bacterium]